MRRHPREPLIDPSLSPPGGPVTALIFSSSPRRTYGTVSHLTHADRARIEQAAYVLATADVDEGACDVGSAMTSFRSWTPHHGSIHDVYAAVVLTLVVVDGVRCVVATWCWTDSQCQWVPWVADESKRTAVMIDAAIARASMLVWAQ